MSMTQGNSFNYDHPMRIALIIGVVAAVVSAAGLILFGPGIFFQSYLFSFLFWMGISLGSLGLLFLHLLVGNRWGLTIRRITEASAGSIWIMAVLFIPLLFGLRFLYPWARPSEVAASSLLQYKSFYLNVPFFVIRAIIYFAAWILLAYFANRRVAQYSDTQEGNLILRGRFQGLGAAGLIIYAITMTFASVDWLMSLEPEWTSTAYGLVIIMGQVLAATAFAVFVMNWLPGLSRGRDWNFETTPIPYRDLGAIILTMVISWAYLAYFEFLIIWSGNIPREVEWYTNRTEGGWSYVAIFIAVFGLAIPFIILLSSRVRFSLRALAALGAMLVFVSLANMFWQVKPAFYPGQFAISLSDIFMPIAIGGVWLATFFYTLKRRPALTTDDEVALEVTRRQEKSIP